MAPRSYTNFDLALESGPDGLFRARVLSSPVGLLGEVIFTLPLDPTTLENLMLKLDPGRQGTRRAASDPQVEAGRQLGTALFDTIFAGDVALAWSQSRQAATAGGQGLRLRLHLGGAPQIAGLPWELLHDSRTRSFLAQSDRTPVVRFLDIPQVQPPLRLARPLRVLAVISSPSDLPELDVDAEWEHLQEALSAKVSRGRVDVHRLPAPTLTELGRWLRRNPVHVLHFIGHGDYDRRLEDGVLYFCDQYGRSTPVTASTLGPYVHDHDPLRMIVLNACRSSVVDATDPFGGMAQRLVQQQAGAVVAMQFPITDRAATTFTSEFYGAIADGFPVDQAVTAARKALLAGFGAEWATPTLFMHTDHGHVFDPVETQVEAERQDHAQRACEVQRDTDAQTQPHRIPGTAGTSARTGRTRSRRWLLPALAGAILLVGGLAYLTYPWGGEPDPEGDQRHWVSAAGFVVPPTIDGLDDDWDDVQDIYLGHTEVDNGDGDPTFGASWRLGWNSEHYFVFVDVADAAVTQHHEAESALLFHGDSVHFDLGGYRDEGEEQEGSPEDVKVLLAPTPDGEVVSALVPWPGIPGLGNAPLTAGPVPGIVAATVVHGDGYTIEAAIPWESLNVQGVRSGLHLVTNLYASNAYASGPTAGSLRTLLTNNDRRSSGSDDSAGSGSGSGSDGELGWRSWSVLELQD